MLSTFCYSYPKCQSISLESCSHSNLEHSIVNIAGILHHQLHLHRSGLVDSSELCFLSTTTYRSTYIADSRTCENSDTPYFRISAINMIKMITYCTDTNIKIAAVYIAHALFNSAKGFTLSTNPLCASLTGYSGNAILCHA